LIFSKSVPVRCRGKWVSGGKTREHFIISEKQILTNRRMPVKAAESQSSIPNDEEIIAQGRGQQLA
jgi:hypothetical protein